MTLVLLCTPESISFESVNHAHRPDAPVYTEEHRRKQIANDMPNTRIHMALNSEPTAWVFNPAWPESECVNFSR